MEIDRVLAFSNLVVSFGFLTSISASHCHAWHITLGVEMLRALAVLQQEGTVGLRLDEYLGFAYKPSTSGSQKVLYEVILMFTACHT